MAKTKQQASVAKAPATKTARTKAIVIPSVKGVTEMTKEKHKYEGYSVRVQLRGNVFRQYVSASEKSRPESTLPQRKAGAHKQSVELIGELNAILNEKKSWVNGTDTLRPSAIKAVKALAFKQEVAKPREAVA